MISLASAWAMRTVAGRIAAGRTGRALVAIRDHPIAATAMGIDAAVQAVRQGACDFIQKPWENERVLATVRTQVELGRALRRSQRQASGRLSGRRPPTIPPFSMRSMPILGG